MRKIDEILSDGLDLDNIKVLIKIKNIHKIEKENSIDISDFENKKSIYQKNLMKINMWTYYLWDKRQKTFLLNILILFMYDRTLHHRKNVFAVIVYKLSVQKKY